MPMQATLGTAKSVLQYGDAKEIYMVLPSTPFSLFLSSPINSHSVHTQRRLGLRPLANICLRPFVDPSITTLLEQASATLHSF